MNSKGGDMNVEIVSNTKATRVEDSIIASEGKKDAYKPTTKHLGGQKCTIRNLQF